MDGPICSLRETSIESLIVTAAHSLSDLWKKIVVKLNVPARI